MPHLKCDSCRTRSYAPCVAEPIDDLCPSCGCAFEPAGQLRDLVGFRAVTARDAAGAQHGLVDRLGGLLDRRAREQTRPDSRSEEYGAIADAIALPAPKRTR
jgi:hypothetical protein